ncbi:MAG: glycosyltransferase family 4 protein [Actinomycetota bacterium]
MTSPSARTKPRRAPLALLAVNPTGLFSGAELALVRLLETARADGWDVTVAAPEGPLTEQLDARAFHCIEIPELRFSEHRRSVALAIAAMRSFRVGSVLRHAAADADLVLVNGLHALPALRVARVRRTVAWFVHDVVGRMEQRAVLAVCGSAVRLALAPSEAVAVPLRTAGLNVRVIRNGTPWPVVAAPAPADPPLVGVSAVLTPWKGQDVLLEAVAGLARDDVIVELMGGTFPRDHEFVRGLERRAAEPDLAGRVRMLGHVDDPLDRLRRWTVAVSSSVDPEAAPLNVLEAMSVGVPLVGTDHGGVPEVLGDAGILVPPRDASEMSAAIARLLDEPELHRRCAAAGPRLVAAGLTLERNQRELARALRAAIEPGARRVVFAVPDYFPSPGGTSRQVANMARALRERGYDVQVVTRRRDRGWSRRELVDGVPVARIGRTRGGRVAEKLAVLSFAAWLARRRRRIDVVQVVMYPDYALAASMAGMARRTIISWAGIGDASDVLRPARDPLRLAQLAGRRRALRRCTNTALTEAMAAELAGLGVTAQVVPLPVDLDYFRPPDADERRSARDRLGLAPTDLAVVYTGHLRRLKGIDRLVDAFDRLRPRVRGHGRLFLVGGESPTADACEADLREQVRRLGLEQAAIFTGPVRDVRGYLWAADAFVLPSHREGMSNSLIEAMACGVACVAPAEPVGAEVLGEAGIVTADNTPESLLKALVELADDTSERARLGAAALEAVKAWSLPVVVDRHEQLYESITGAPGVVG